MKVRMKNYVLSDGLNLILNEKKGAVIEVDQELGDKLVNTKKVATFVKELAPMKTEKKNLEGAPSNKSVKAF